MIEARKWSINLTSLVLSNILNFQQYPKKQHADARQNMRRFVKRSLNPFV